MSIILNIQKNGDTFLESDLDSKMPEILNFYDGKIRRQAYTLYGSVVGLNAYKYLAKSTIRNSIHTFVIDKKMHKTRNLDSYVKTALNNLFLSEKRVIHAKKIVTTPVCQACRHYGEVSYLFKQNDKYCCSNCSNEDIISYMDKEQAEFRKIFANISLVGHKCDLCQGFVPWGMKYCPYPNCNHFGKFSSSKTCPRMRGGDIISFMEDLSICATKENSEQGTCSASFLEDDYNILNNIIDFNIRRVNKVYQEKGILKSFMLRAYKNVLIKQPDDMLSYLIYKRVFTGEQSIQSIIFQEFVSIIEDALPFDYRGREVFSIKDAHLELFWRESEFSSVVKDGGIIYNETKERYIGSLTMKDYGPYFIGKILSISGDGRELINEVKRYQFSKIMTGLSDGLEVVVRHLALPSHWEIGKMLLLQRTRSDILESIEKQKDKFEGRFVENTTKISKEH